MLPGPIPVKPAADHSAVGRTRFAGAPPGGSPARDFDGPRAWRSPGARAQSEVEGEHIGGPPPAEVALVQPPDLLRRWLPWLGSWKADASRPQSSARRISPATASPTGVRPDTPTQTGSFPITVQVKDSSSPPQTASQGFTLVISAAGTAIPASFWGLIISKASHPLQVPYGQFRGWDSGAEWPNI